MNYCPRCGAPIGFGQNFCRNCGLPVREKPTPERILEGGGPRVRGLGRNTLVYLTLEGLQGFEVRPAALLFLVLLAPLPFLAAIYYMVQAGALAVYATLWIITSALLYDELKWRGLKKFDANSPVPEGRRERWLVPWQSIRMADWNGKTLWFTSANPSRKLSVTFNQDDAPLVERTLNSWGVRYAWRPPKLPPTLTRYWTLVLTLFIIGQAILILAATLPFFSGEQQTYTTVLNDTRSRIAGTTLIGEFQTIFLNNLQVAWGGALPFLGTLTYGIASYNTGRVVQAIAISDQIPSSLVLVELYLFPHTWVEESAYPIATAAGLLAFTKWRSVSPGEFVRRLNRGSTKLALALGGAALILVVAGVLEVIGTYLRYGVLLLWLPLALLFYAGIRIATNRNRSRANPPLGSP